MEAVVALLSLAAQAILGLAELALSFFIYKEKRDIGRAAKKAGKKG